jgi:hypothetical protein
MTLDRLEGRILSISAGRTKTGRARMSAQIPDDDGNVWLAITCNGRARAALAALAPGDRALVHGRSDRETLRFIARAIEPAQEGLPSGIADATGPGGEQGG